MLKFFCYLFHYQSSSPYSFFTYTSEKNPENEKAGSESADTGLGNIINNELNEESLCFQGGKLTVPVILDVLGELIGKSCYLTLYKACRHQI